jgi:hypothetical protein
MEEPGQDIVTNLPRPEPVDQQHMEPGPGLAIFDVKNVSIWYSAWTLTTQMAGTPTAPST